MHMCEGVGRTFIFQLKETTQLLMKLLRRSTLPQPLHEAGRSWCALQMACILRAEVSAGDHQPSRQLARVPEGICRPGLVMPTGLCTLIMEMWPVCRSTCQTQVL